MKKGTLSKERIARLEAIGSIRYCSDTRSENTGAHPEFSLEQWQAMMPDKYVEDSLAFTGGLRKAGLT